MFSALLKKLGKGLETFKFLLEAEGVNKLMYRDMLVGPPFANLIDELYDRKNAIKHFEVDWINLLPH